MRDITLSALCFRLRENETRSTEVIYSPCSKFVDKSALHCSPVAITNQLWSIDG